MALQRPKAHIQLVLSSAWLRDNARRSSIFDSTATWEPPVKIDGKAQKQAESHVKKPQATEAHGIKLAAGASPKPAWK
ncbi:MAG TPA: hypothetical protein VJW20_06985 [Candidatus Angelobacter sp.]|nr:hypothetical protein [Candidatus Angelobacter sp.]